MKQENAAAAMDTARKGGGRAASSERGWRRAPNRTAAAGDEGKAATGAAPTSRGLAFPRGASLRAAATGGPPAGAWPRNWRAKPRFREEGNVRRTRDRPRSAWWPGGAWRRRSRRVRRGRSLWAEAAGPTRRARSSRRLPIAGRARAEAPRSGPRMSSFGSSGSWTAEQAARAVKTLRSPRAELPKKRQLMRALFGDYRARMEEDRKAALKAMEAAARSAQVLPVEEAVRRKSGRICRRRPGGETTALASPEEEFKFNFF